MGTGISGGTGLILEFLGTFFLVMTVLATINSKRGHAAGYLQPLSIGIAILVAHMFLVSDLFVTSFYEFSSSSYCVLLFFNYTYFTIHLSCSINP